MSLSIKSDVVDLFPGGVAMDQDRESVIFDLRGANGFSVELSWENGFDPVGTLIISVSNSANKWIPIWSYAVATDSGEAGLDYLTSNFAYGKVDFDFTSGIDAVLSGTATIKRY
jgi:hypothetical protein